MTELVLFILIFLVAGLAALGGNLLLGRLVRPDRPSPEKGQVYECGEEPTGTAWVQFDVRFYVVALLFVIFDVELAFFFPWAVVFGSATRAGDEARPDVERIQAAHELQPPLLPEVHTQPRMKVDRVDASKQNAKTSSETPSPDTKAMQKLAWIAFADILVFFGVLLVGFAYLWRRGDLKWVRSLASQEEPSGSAEGDRSTQPLSSGAAVN